VTRNGYVRSRREFLAGILSEQWVGAFVVAVLVVHAVAAWCNIGFLNSDEHYQIIEFAQYKLGRQQYAALAWEFPARMRPALQPWLAAGVIVADRAVGIVSPFVVASSLRLLSTVLALWVSLELCVRVLPAIGDRWLRRAALYASFLAWMAPTVHARFSSENWGGALLVGGLCLVLDALDAWPTRRGRAIGLASVAGLVWSAAFYCRFQTALAIAGAACWLLAVRRAPRALVVVLAVGFVVGCGLNEGLDSWMYGAWTFAPYNYVQMNLVQGKAATFPTAPWWMLFVYMAVALVPPYSLALLALLAVGGWFARRDALVWMAVPFVIVHAVLARKDPRFLIPLLYLLGPLFAVCVDALPSALRARLGAWRRTWWGRANLVAFATINAVALMVTMAVPVRDTAVLDRWLWEQGRRGPTAVYSIGEPPYDAGDLVMNSFYLRRDLTAVPFTTLADLRAEHRSSPVFVYFKGVVSPPPLAGVDCPPVLRTFPVWLAQIELFRRLTRIEVGTLCRLDMTVVGPGAETSSAH
jgi:phosphatidylinositol glycan class B